MARPIESYEDERDELVRERVRELMRGETKNPKDDFSLSLPANLDEFMAECGEAVHAELLMILHDLPDRSDRNRGFESLGRTFYVAYFEYMEALALSRAEREVPKAWELREQEELTEAERRADMRRDELREAYRHAA